MSAEVARMIGERKNHCTTGIHFMDESAVGAGPEMGKGELPSSWHTRKIATVGQYDDGEPGAQDTPSRFGGGPTSANWATFGGSSKFSNGPATVPSESAISPR